MDFLIHPRGHSERLVKIKLPSPKEGETDRTYLVDQINFTVNEIVQHHDEFRSWFADDLLSKDGSLNMMTPVDRLFIMLPFLIKSKDQFRTLHDIISSTTCSDDLSLVLSPDTDWSLISDTKEIESELYLRFNQEKTIEWLKKKRTKVIDVLREEMDSSTSLATLRSYSNDLLADYLPNELSDVFKENSCNEITISTDSTVVKPNSVIATGKTPRTMVNSKRKSDSKEQPRSGDKSSNKLTKYFSKVSR